jgi:predicted dithiol-disulfide oxidoreductase (DUF899 family)
MMTKHKTGTRKEWLTARLKLLKDEKELTKRSDELAQRRQQLPWVRIDKQYQFETDEGSASLEDLFQGRSQLLVYHFMFGPDYTAGCPSCSANRGRLQRNLDPPGKSRCDALGGIARATSEAAGVQAADGLDISVGVFLRRQLQLRFQCPANRRATTQGRRRIQLRAGGGVAPGGIRRSRHLRSHVGNRASYVRAGETGHERVRARGGRRLPHLLYLCAGTRRALGMYQWLDRAPKGRNEAEGLWWRHHDQYQAKI